MGYKPQTKLYNLEYNDYPGLEIFARGASLGTLLELGQIKMSADMNEALRDKVFGFFATRIAKWNMEHPEIEPLDDGRVPEVCPRCGLAEDVPMPISTESLMCLDVQFVFNLIVGWMSVLTRITGPKEPNSNDGETNSLTAEYLRKLDSLASPLKLPEPS
jgi:hypothetical protein